ncbi:hypothetical protein RHGRI_016791 [Rhododendron griersonianum]|uniref:Uncharacterized protein n=1 Tax=Rhododendron griersonianum TaxID=479676 RepID=A0AAV6JVH1_9ERIC|nr:hypothetical protein RHGRI_016791 [Rhododendron griersonianum]
MSTASIQSDLLCHYLEYTNRYMQAVVDEMIFGNVDPLKILCVIIISTKYKPSSNGSSTESFVAITDKALLKSLAQLQRFGHSKAEEEDDEGFSDFSFASSFSSSNQINGQQPTLSSSSSSDDKGDFVESPLRSVPPTGVLNAQSSWLSDPFGLTQISLDVGTESC